MSSRYRFRVKAVNKLGESVPCEMKGGDILIKVWSPEETRSLENRQISNIFIDFHLNTISKLVCATPPAPRTADVLSCFFTQIPLLNTGVFRCIFFFFSTPLTERRGCVLIKHFSFFLTPCNNLHTWTVSLDSYCTCLHLTSNIKYSFSQLEQL